MERTLPKADPQPRILKRNEVPTQVCTAFFGLLVTPHQVALPVAGALVDAEGLSDLVAQRTVRPVQLAPAVVLGLRSLAPPRLLVKQQRGVRVAPIGLFAPVVLYARTWTVRERSSI